MESTNSNQFDINKVREEKAKLLAETYRNGKSYSKINKDFLINIYNILKF
jgi:hypothetical protein